MARITQLRVNGRRCPVDADSETSLLSVLRNQAGLTGTKYGCGEGQCGACTVLLDGFPRRSCITKAASAVNKEITTIEGLAKGGQLHPLQEAFWDAAAFQCGYCTSGMILTAVALLKTNPNPSSQQISHFMQGNICRCGTYPRIIAAIQKAAQLTKEARP